MRKFICSTCGNSFESAKYDKNRIPKYCSRKCYQIRVKPIETIKKMSDAKKGKSPWNKGFNMWEGRIHPRGKLGKKGRGGENCHFWRGGVCDKNEKIRKSPQYKLWRRKIFERDNFTCQICQKRGKFLHADHILPFSTHIEKRFELDNGRTLCKKCHFETDTYGGKMIKKNSY